MDRFLIKKKNSEQASNILESSKRIHEEINLDELPADPGERRKISEYHPNDREKIRRAYLQRGPCQPHCHNFPQREFGKVKRRFNVAWFELYNWLEYSVKKDAAFCLYCYLCDTSFAFDGFNNWKKPERFKVHVGGINSAHNQARRRCEDLMNQDQNIGSSFAKQSEQTKIQYETRLLASVVCARFLLHQGLAFRGHDESEGSSNQGNFLELLKFLAEQNEETRKVVLQNAPGNLKLSSNKIQVDIVSACAIETTKVIVEDIRSEIFSILVDECRDVSGKEQMALVLRYVNKKGYVNERFLGIIHIPNATSLTLKGAIESLLARHELTVSQIRGQGYDGASNMRGEFNGLKSLILKENGSAFYIHCFAHQLQLVLIAIAKNHVDIGVLFNMISGLVNIVGASCKRRDMLREKQREKVIEAIVNGETLSGKVLHQEYSLQRASETRWGSHYTTLINIEILFSSVIDILEYVLQDGVSTDQKADAYVLLDWVQSFEFAFAMNLMKNILGITNELSQALKRKEQDIVNAMDLVNISKQRLQLMRDSGWEDLVKEVSSFCEKYGIVIPDMNDAFVARGKSRRKAPRVTNLHHFENEVFKTVVDWMFQELNNRFDEVNTELLLGMACLNPVDSYSSFNEEKLKKVIRLAELYPSDFSETDHVVLGNQLKTFIMDMQSNIQFTGIKGIGELAAKLVEMKKHIVYPLVYQLIKLVLVLPISTASVERAFSAMKIVKTRLRNKIGDQWMNDCLVTFIEKDVFRGVENELILKRFQNMTSRRGQLPKKR